MRKLVIEHQVFDEVDIQCFSGVKKAIVLKIEYALYKKMHLINDDPNIRVSHIESVYKGTFLVYTVRFANGITLRVAADRINKSITSLNNVTIVEED